MCAGLCCVLVEVHGCVCRFVLCISRVSCLFVQVCILVEVHVCVCVRPREPPRQRYVKTGASQLLEKRKENFVADEELQGQREVGVIH